MRKALRADIFILSKDRKPADLLSHTNDKRADFLLFFR